MVARESRRRWGYQPALLILGLLGPTGAQALPPPLLGPDGPVWLGPLSPGSHASVRAGRDTVIVDASTGSLHVEAVDISSSGWGPPLEIRRIHDDAGWRWSFEDSLEIQPEGLALHLLDGTHNATSPGDATWPWEVDSQLEGPHFEARKVKSGWEVVHDGLVDIFSDDGDLVSRSDPYNTRLSYHRENEHLSEIRASDGRFIHLLRDEDERLSVVRFSDGREVYYEYRGSILSAVDSETRPRSRYIYDDKGRIRTILWPDTSRVHIRRNNNGRVTSILGPGAHATSLNWTGSAVSIQSSNGATSRLVFLDNGYRFTDSTGRSVRVTQDGHGILKWADPRGLETRILRDSKRHVVGLESPGGANWRLDWSPTAPIAVVDPAGGRWRLGRNSKGSVVSTTGPDGRTTRLQRNDRGSIRAIESGSAPLRFSRNTHGQITAIQAPTGATSRIDWNQSGHLARVQDPAGNNITLTGFHAGRPSTLIERDDGVWAMEYDAMGRIKRIDSPTGGNLEIQRNLSGRPTRLNTRSGVQVGYDWNAEGFLTRVTDTHGGQYRLRYDAAGRLKLVDRPDGSQLVVDREPNSEIVRLGHSSSPMTIRRDLRGNPVQLGSLSWSWDSTGRWTGVKSDVLDLFLSRSASGTVRSIQIGDQSVTQITRDSAGRVTALGQGENKLSISRDPAGRVSGIKPPKGQPIRLDRDERGLVAIIYADPLRVRILRDRSGRVLKWTAADSTSISAARDASGRVKHIRFSDGSLTRVEREESTMFVTLESPSGKPVLERRVTRDTSGLSAHITETGISNRVLTHRRDPLGNLVALETGSEAWSWLPGQIEGEGGTLVLLDEQGRPLEASPPNGPAAWAIANERLVYLFDPVGRLERVVGEAEHLTLQHDGLGRLTRLSPGEKPGWEIQWDALGWPSHVVSPSGTTLSLIHDGTHLLGWMENDSRHEILPAMGFGAQITGDSSWWLPGDETGQVRAEGQSPDSLMPLGFSPLGFPDRAPVHRISTPGSWELFAGGPILDKQGARDPVSGRYTTMGFTPDWWTTHSVSPSWPKLDQSSSPWWAPSPWVATGPWHDPLKLLVDLGVIPQFLDGKWLSLHPAPPPAGWLPEEAGSSPPSWLVSTDDLPLDVSGLEAVALRAGLTPSQPIQGEDILEALLGPDFKSLTQTRSVFGEDWRWWLMGIDNALLAP